MKVFISWSGRTSEAVALVLRDWLPSVIQSIDPYVSSEDIEKGARWGSEISKELEASDFGILCVTPSNTGAPWLNFEAGALSKSIDRSRVVPFLFRLDRADVPQGPLVQFQSVLAERDDVKRMVLALNAACGDQALEEGRLARFFDVWWPRLEEQLSSIETDENTGTSTRRSEQDLLSEVLELVRGQQQILSNPAALLPPDYINALVRGGLPGETLEPELIQDLLAAYTNVFEAVRRGDVPAEVEGALIELARPMQGIRRRLGRWQSAPILREEARDDPYVIREQRARLEEPRPYVTREQRARRTEAPEAKIIREQRARREEARENVARGRRARREDVRRTSSEDLPDAPPEDPGSEPTP